MRQRPGRRALQRPTSLVWVERVATSSLDLSAVHVAEVGEDGGDIIPGRRGGRDASHGCHRVVERRQRMLGAREEKEVHSCQEQKGTPLWEWCAIEERQQVVMVGDRAADGGVGRTAVTLDHGGEASEVVGQRLFDEHGG